MANSLPEQIELIKREIELGTGAGIGIEVNRKSRQTGLRIWFSDLDRSKSPLVELKPWGLSRHRIDLTFGTFSRPTIENMSQADSESVELARALVQTVEPIAPITIYPPNRSFQNWEVTDPGFSIQVEKSYKSDRFGEMALVATCREIVTPLLGAMAELYGYVFVVDTEPEPPDLMEGGVSQTTVTRRERNPRNRLLCLRLHKNICAICNLDPIATYGESMEIIEVHHLQPLSLQSEPRPYNPKTDLIPLCPNCHRAVHKRRPVPWDPDEIKRRINTRTEIE